MWDKNGTKIYPNTQDGSKEGGRRGEMVFGEEEMSSERQEDLSSSLPHPMDYPNRIIGQSCKRDVAARQFVGVNAIGQLE